MRLADRLVVAGARRARLLLGSRRRVRHRRPRDGSRGVPSDDLASPEHDHRRSRRRRPARCPQAPEASGVRHQPRRIRGRLAEGTAPGSRAPDTSRPRGGARGHRPRLRRGAGRDRILKRVARGSSAPHPLAQGPVCADRHRPAALRAGRPRRRDPHGRRAADDQPAAAEALALLQASQADARPGPVGSRAAPARAGLRVQRDRDQARLGGAGVLPPAPHGLRRQAFPDVQVPDDGRQRRHAA